MSLIKFLNPLKFPNQRGASKVNEPLLTISVTKHAFGVNMSLFNKLNTALPNFTHLQIAEEEILSEDKKSSSVKYHLVPCKDTGWPIKVNTKASSCYFSSKGLHGYLIEKFQLGTSVNLIKVPIAETPVKLKDVPVQVFELLF
jgi:hypothetical protein